MDRSGRQKLGVQKWVKAGGRGVLAWTTGVGKTRAALLAIKMFLSKNKNKKIKVIIPTEHLKIQWLQELIKYNLHNDVTLEIINSAVERPEKIDFLILDEIHMMLGERYINIFKVKDPTLILGLSATFERLDNRQELIKHYCPVVDIITLQEAIENDWLSNYREYKVNIRPDDIQLYKEINVKFLDSFAIFNYDFNLGMKCVTNIIFRRTYGKQLNLSAKEIDAITFTWNKSLQERKSYVMNHPKKIEITKKIIEARPFSKIITFSNTVKQASQIKIGDIVYSKPGNKKKNELILKNFNNQTSGVLNAVKSMDAGVDISGLNLAIILSNSSSSTQKTQRVGRIIRYEEGKLSEVFTLIFPDTMENNWFLNSNKDKSYIEIEESELDLILYGTLDRESKQGEQKDQLFRL